MKKFLSVLLICIMIISTLAGCGTSVDGSPAASSKPTTKPTPTPTQTPTKNNDPIPSPSKVTTSKTSDGWRYALEKNVMTLFGYEGEETVVTIPEVINYNGTDYKVQVLDTYAICKETRIYVGDSKFTCTLDEVIIPDTIDSIPIGFFEMCDNLSKVSWKGFKVVNNVVFSKDMTILYYCLNKDITSYKIPSSVTTIAGGAFRGCDQLTKIDIPSNVEVLQNYAFYGCTALQSVNIESGLKSMGSQLFTLCTNLESLIIPETVEAFGDQFCTYHTGLEIYIKEGSPVDVFFKEIKDSSDPFGDATTFMDYVKYLN